MENKNLTAVEWLADMIETMEAHGGDLPPLMIHIKKAKQMEREQIIEAHTVGYIIGGGNGDLYNPEEYYNETYKQD